MPDLRTSKRLLLCSDNPVLTESVLRIQRSAGHEVMALTCPAEASTWLQAHPADLVIVHVDMDAETVEDALRLVEVLSDARSPATPAVLVLARVHRSEDWTKLFHSQRLTNLLGVGPDDSPDPGELAVTTSKILSGDIFGVGRYLGPEPTIRAQKVRRSTDKDGLLAQAEKFALQAGCTRRLTERIGVAVDELFTNAIYNAPVDHEGRPRFAHFDRRRAVELQPGEDVTVTFATDGRRLCVSALDCFGSLPPARVQAYLAKCFGRGADQVDQKQGGAGLGLYLLFNLVRSFVTNIAPGRATESMGIFEIARSRRARSVEPKSFHLFVAGQHR